MDKAEFICKYCDRKYKSKNYLNRHILVCEILSKTQDERKQEEAERADTPTLRKMYELLMEMTLKYAGLEKKFNALQKSIESKKKRLNIIDWLNTNHSSANTITFADWCAGVKLERKHLEFIFETNYIPGITNIFEEFLPINKADSLPIRSFDQKINTLFIYIDNTHKWKIMSDEDFGKMVGVISKQIMCEFVKWQRENYNNVKNKTDDNHDIQYATNIQKVIGAKFTKQQLYSKIRAALYNHLKMNLKNIIEYEFSF